MILHVDMDAFYASVEERENPLLKNQAVVVGGTGPRGVVSAANYQARAFGIHSAMPMVVARRLYPGARFVAPQHRLYVEVSRQINQIFQRYTPLVEPLSLDEAFLDVTSCEKLHGPAAVIGRRIKQEIASEINLVASVGVADNKFLAKLASDLQKPDGFVVIMKDQAQQILDPLTIDRLWGVGKSTQIQLKKIGIETIADLRHFSQEELGELLGKRGFQLWQLAHGIDDRKVSVGHIAKSVSHETTFAVDIRDEKVLETRLLDLCEQVCRRLRDKRCHARTVSLKLRYHDFRTINRRYSLDQGSDLTSEVWQIIRDLFRHKVARPLAPVRLIGVAVSGLTRSPTQATLFEQVQRRQRKKIDQLTDTIIDKFGNTAIRRGGALRRNKDN